MPVRDGYNFDHALYTVHARIHKTEVVERVLQAFLRRGSQKF
jgi:hypothetical protein